MFRPVCILLNLYLMAVFARVVLSWFPLRPDGAMATVAGFLYVVTDPVMNPGSPGAAAGQGSLTWPSTSRRSSSSSRSSS